MTRVAASTTTTLKILTAVGIVDALDALSSTIGAEWSIRSGGGASYATSIIVALKMFIAISVEDTLHALGFVSGTENHITWT